MEAESRKGRRCDDNQATCPFTQDLCIKFDVIFTVDAEIVDDSIEVECSG